MHTVLVRALQAFENSPPLSWRLCPYNVFASAAGVPAARRAVRAAAEPDPAGRRGGGRRGAGAPVLATAAGGARRAPCPVHQIRERASPDIKYFTPSAHLLPCLARSLSYEWHVLAPHGSARLSSPCRRCMACGLQNCSRRMPTSTQSTRQSSRCATHWSAALSCSSSDASRATVHEPAPQPPAPFAWHHSRQSVIGNDFAQAGSTC